MDVLLALVAVCLVLVGVVFVLQVLVLIAVVLGVRKVKGLQGTDAKLPVVGTVVRRDELVGGINDAEVDELDNPLYASVVFHG